MDYTRERETFVYVAKLAEEAERYEGEVFYSRFFPLYWYLF